ncbi:MAG: GYD domain-containing protein [Hyphomicrobiales bacterium]|nr:GYD domain-containing protein [Hyphomicrobiales bacterium]MBV9432186.1 GYD domain-containing protein [Hyphomicrobiales bacterium]
MHWYLAGNYTSAAMKALGEKPSDRHAAATKLVTAGGGKLISFYRTAAEGPGVLIIFEADPITAVAINGIVVAGGALTNIKFMRLWDDEEVKSIRKKRAEIEGAYKPPG